MGDFTCMRCVKLLTEAVRDEHTWRKGTTTGVDPDAGALLQRMPHVPCWILFVFKCVTPWIFGYAYSANLWLYMNLLPLCADFLATCQTAASTPSDTGQKDLSRQHMAIFISSRSLLANGNTRSCFGVTKARWQERSGSAALLEKQLAEVDVEISYIGLRT